MEAKDFRVRAWRRGYQVQYKGKDIGGFSMSPEIKSPTGPDARERVKHYTKCGSIDIRIILAGEGEKRFLEAIAVIDIAEKLKLTVEQYLEHSGLKCPFCESDQITGDEWNAEGSSATQEATCNECGGSWYDLYELKGYEVIAVP